KQSKDSEQCCGHGHDKEFSLSKTLSFLGVGIVFYVAALTLDLAPLSEIFLFLVSYLIISGDIVWKAVKNIIRGKVFDENFLLTVATVGAFAIRQFPEAVAVMLFFKVGELFQDLAVNKSKKSIKALLEIRPDYANLKTGKDIEKVDPNSVDVKDIIVIKPGEKVPLDGIVLEGSSMMDTSALTGESVPKTVGENDNVYSGAINKTGLLTVEVTKIFGESTVSKILELVENTSSQKAPTEKFITKFARYYTPIVVYCAVFLAVVPVLLYNTSFFQPFFTHSETFSEWIYKALVFLVISCPCALVISIPLGFFGGIGASSKVGVLVKGSNYLEALNNVNTLVWDKTGTLTKGVFQVTEIVPVDGFNEEDLLKLAAQAENHSNHPIAESIRKAFGRAVNEELIKDYQEVAGYGIKATIEGKNILIGNDKFLHKENIDHDTCDVQGTVVHVVSEKKYAGYIVISDEIKDNVKEAIQNLQSLGIKNQIMLTGDNENVGKRVSQELGLSGYYAQLLPQHKVEKLEEIIQQRKSEKDLVMFVGDGINDAPVLMRADIGVAMGALGSDAAIEAADIVLMNDEPSSLYEAIKIAQRTRHIVWQNIAFALAV
ncbi:Lead, cadmium, zinc and mercury transporting ATPase; Copper-translocating P-type ATPase, partial [hydrothermal vent metagenome]